MGEPVGKFFPTGDEYAGNPKTEGDTRDGQDRVDSAQRLFEGRWGCLG